MIRRLALLSMVSFSLCAYAGEHPVLFFTEKSVKEISASRGSVPMFDKSVETLVRQADEALSRPLCIPVPADGGGGYSHEMHKQNYYDMYYLGIAWQITGRREYAAKVRDILNAYAQIYPSLGYHPLKMSSTPGRVFWQTLNESVWLVHTSVAYDCIYDFLSAKERRHIETELLRPWAVFVMEGTEDNRANLEVFNLMHNHGTWSDVAVGMAGMAMGDDSLVDKALYGTDLTGKNGGFICQLDNLFSPDGYYTEGAYYHRYAIWPFVLFAQCISHYRPGLDIFAYRDSIITKAVSSLLQLSYNGSFLLFNDALEKNFDAQELQYAVDIAYYANPADKSILSVARDWHGEVIVSDAGYAVARDITAGLAEELRYPSMLLRDGKDGKDGAVALLRNPGSLLFFKAASHGLSHGHYDRLGMAYYDNGNEVLPDYGSARFVNVEAKHKGGYTRENKTYAMQTVAHNTLVVDCKSHYGGKIKQSSEHSPEILSSNVENPDFQYVSATDANAYSGVAMSRWLAYARIPFLEHPLILDVLKAESDEPHHYDLPFHYNGHMVSLNVPYTRSEQAMYPLGEEKGYRHLWLEAEAEGAEGTTSYSWMLGNRMYSLSTATTSRTQIKLVRTGANDPDFNLRSEPAVIIREEGCTDHVFASCIETHGKFDMQTEQAVNLVHSCKSVRVLKDDRDSIEVEYVFINGNSFVLAVNRADNLMQIKQLKYENKK